MTTLLRINNRLSPDDLFSAFFRPVQNDARGAHPIRIDVSEDADAYRVAALLPGVNKEDIHVSVDQDEVTIAAEVKRAAVAEGERVLHTERTYGKLTRVFTVGQEIDDSAVQAKYADGILSLVLPKKAPVSAKRIAVE